MAEAGQIAEARDKLPKAEELLSSDSGDMRRGLAWVLYVAGDYEGVGTMGQKRPRKRLNQLPDDPTTAQALAAAKTATRRAKAGDWV